MHTEISLHLSRRIQENKCRTQKNILLCKTNKWAKPCVCVHTYTYILYIYYICITYTHAHIYYMHGVNRGRKYFWKNTKGSTSYGHSVSFCFVLVLPLNVKKLETLNEEINDERWKCEGFWWVREKGGNRCLGMIKGVQGAGRLRTCTERCWRLSKENLE